MKVIIRMSLRVIRMVVPAHLGVGHPNLIWIVVVGIMAFGAGLGVNLYRSRRDSSLSNETVVGDEE